MSYAYEGSASVGVLALYRGQPPNQLTTYELNVRILKVGPQRFRLEFHHYLQGPQEANAIQVIMPATPDCRWQQRTSRRVAADLCRAVRTAA